MTPVMLKVYLQTRVTKGIFTAEKYTSKECDVLLNAGFVTQQPSSLGWPFALSQVIIHCFILYNLDANTTYNDFTEITSSQSHSGP